MEMGKKNRVDEVGRDAALYERVAAGLAAIKEELYPVDGQKK